MAEGYAGAVMSMGDGPHVTGHKARPWRLTPSPPGNMTDTRPGGPPASERTVRRGRPVFNLLGPRWGQGEIAGDWRPWPVRSAMGLQIVGVAVTRPYAVDLAGRHDVPATPSHGRPALVGLALPSIAVHKAEASTFGHEKGIGVAVHSVTVS